MSIEILMPALSPTMEEGKLAKWLVKEGDTVKSGDILAEIETDKATMEFEAVDEGRIGKLLVPEGTEGVKVNAPIATLMGDGENPEDDAATQLKSPRPQETKREAEAAIAREQPKKRDDPTPVGAPHPRRGTAGALRRGPGRAAPGPSRPAAPGPQRPDPVVHPAVHPRLGGPRPGTAGPVHPADQIGRAHV